MIPFINKHSVTLCAVLLTAIALLVFRACDDRTVAVGTAQSTLRIDTLTRTIERVVQAPPIVVHSKPDVIERLGAPVYQIDTVNGKPDTVLFCEPFRMAFRDTLASGDTLDELISFPPLSRSLTLLQAPDTLRDRQQVLTVTQTIREAEPWYETAGKAFLFTGVGYGLRYVTEPDQPDVIYAARSKLQAGTAQSQGLRFSVEIDF